MFILSVKKKNGGEYEPSTLRSYISSIQRVLKRKGYEKSINDIEFAKMKETLSLKQKSLKSLGKGNKPKAATEITDSNIDEMYTAKKLGSDNPHAFLHSMWLLCTMHFGMRTRKKCYNLRRGDVVLLTYDDDMEFLLYDTERQTKTRTGADAKDIRPTKPRAYATPDHRERDPVAMYKIFREKRPDSILTGDSPSFLAVNYNRKGHGFWYKKNAMGINKIYEIMKDMKSGTLFEHNDRITPYSVRKPLVQKLNDRGLPPNQIMQITGHKNVNSLNQYSQYSHLNTNKQKGISHILSNVPSETSPMGSLSALCPTPTASCTVSRAPSDDVEYPPSSQQVNNFSTTDHRNFLTSLMSGNNFYGNVNINITPDSLRQSCESDHARGEKQQLFQIENE